MYPLLDLFELKCEQQHRVIWKQNYVNRFNSQNTILIFFYFRSFDTNSLFQDFKVNMSPCGIKQIRSLRLTEELYMKCNNNVPAPCPAVPISQPFRAAVKIYLFLVPIPIPNSSNFWIRNTESELYKKLGNGNGIGNVFFTQFGNGTEFRFRP